MMNFVKLLAALIAVAVAGVGGWWLLYGRDDHQARFRTVVAERGELLATINATGTIEPEEVIDIGAQVAGMIKELGRDPKSPNGFIDYRSEVEQGTVLAKIDDSLYRASVDQATANMHQAEANVQLAAANLQAMRSKLEQTKRDWDRVQKLGPTKALSELDYDTAKNAWETAAATVPGGEASLEAARKAVEVAKATLQTAQINLNYCTIKSPVKGVIIDRRVNIGQTVVSSLSAPSLFLLAKDLSRIQVWASVNEADISHINPGQSVTFAVDAYPGQRFKGTVLQVRLNATMTQNVVTYTVVVSTENPIVESKSNQTPDFKLKPYSTANLDFEIDRRQDALRVPNAALRWTPTSPQMVTPDVRADYIKSIRAQAGAAGGKATEGSKKDTHDQGRVWVVDGPFVRPVKVRIGLGDGSMTEIVGGDLQEGTPVVAGEIHANNNSDTSNPFTPQMFRKSQ